MHVLVLLVHKCVHILKFFMHIFVLSTYNLFWNSIEIWPKLPENTLLDYKNNKKSITTHNLIFYVINAFNYNSVPFKILFFCKSKKISKQISKPNICQFDWSCLSKRQRFNDWYTGVASFFRCFWEQRFLFSSYPFSSVVYAQTTIFLKGRLCILANIYSYQKIQRCRKHFFKFA